MYIDVWGSFFSSMFVIGSSYVSSLRSHIICIALSCLFVREMSDLLLRTPSHCPFHHYIHCWCDFASCLIWVGHHISLHIHCFAIIFIIACDSSHSFHVLFSPYSNSSRVWYSLRIIITHITISSFLLHLSPYRHHIHVRHPQVHGSWDSLYTLHFIYEGMVFWSSGIWA